ncbi:hypothetical protein AN618_21270 [Fervidicola ferrireducens]|uniref:Flp/Fap pilin component n=1 Tax=Fervidicola ferrireducens TaxID=520764 RepID=A0A140L335_9FIRM|nr:hypothetical protein [Fervidicola ferrireducens]KXG74960.1 hypothetical protein AN618_21270 [Fervidicola ferrireducens]
MENFGNILTTAKKERGETGLFQMLKKVIASEDGQGFMEYALIAALVVIGAIVAFRTLGRGISSKINQVNNDLTNANP